MKVTFIGSGNVAWHMSQAFEDSGHHICEVYSRHIQNANLLLKKLFDAKAVSRLDFSESEANLFVLAVKDDAIAEVLDQLILPQNSILVHTSGSKSLEILKNWLYDNNNLNLSVGVFYPLMTFSKNKKIVFSEIPICIEANNENTETILVELAQKMSKIVYLVDTYEREILHLAAVFCNNFVNHLLSITQNILIDNDLEMNLLKPIIRETISKAILAEDIDDVQTGPARRGDQTTMKSHIGLLRSKPQIEKVYRVMSESIYNHFIP